MTRPIHDPTGTSGLREMPDRVSTVAQELSAEHGAVVRRLARLQQRVTGQMQDSAGRQAALEAENLRLRGELVRLHTAVAWNLRAAVLWSRPVPGTQAHPARAVEGMREAQAVICQTGCAGHAHPWLEPDGQCRRTGQACDRLEDDIEFTADRSGVPHR